MSSSLKWECLFFLLILIVYQVLTSVQALTMLHGAARCGPCPLSLQLSLSPGIVEGFGEIIYEKIYLWLSINTDAEL